MMNKTVDSIFDNNRKYFSVLDNLEFNEKSINRYNVYDDSFKKKPDEYWYDLVENLTMDLSKKLETDFPVFIEQLESSSFVRKVFKALDDVVEEYKNEQKSAPYLKNISAQSAKNFLHLMPIIYTYSTTVAIDSDTGFINAGFSAKDSSLLNALISDSNEIYYSLVGRSEKIFKISGTAKIKSTKDLKQFKRIMAML